MDFEAAIRKNDEQITRLKADVRAYTQRLEASKKELAYAEIEDRALRDAYVAYSVVWENNK